MSKRLAFVVATVVAVVAGVLGLPPAPAGAVAPGSQSGAVFGWGYNVDGEVGDGTTTNRDAPTRTDLPPGVKATAVSAGKSNGAAEHNLAIGSDGNLYAWGSNAYGQLGNTTTTNASTPVVVALPGGVSPTSISAGGNHSLATGSDGVLYAWGRNNSGQLGNGTTTNSSTPVAVQVPAGVSPTSISAGGNQSLAIGNDGVLYAWGLNGSGQLGNGTRTNSSVPVAVSLPTGVSATSVAVGFSHTLAVGSNGTLYAWGSNIYGELGNDTTPNQPTPAAVSLPVSGAPLSITAGYLDSAAVAADGTVYTWGNNAYGELGNGTSGSTTNRTPVAVSLPGGATASTVEMGLYHTLALGTNHVLYAWGYNSVGSLGDGTTTSRSTPAAVAQTATPIAVSAGSYHTLEIALVNPRVTLTAAVGPFNAPFTVTATFSAAVTGLALGDFAVGNGAASNLTAVGSDGTTYQVTIIPTADGAVTVDLPAGSAADSDNADNAAATQLVRTADAAAPTAALTAPTGPFGAPFMVTATFSEAVTGLASSDFTIGDGAASNLAAVGSGGTTYQVTITPAADGAVTVDLPAGAAADAAGNVSSAATQLVRAADATAPTATLTAAAGPFDGSFAVTATFSEAVTGLASSDFTIGDGAASNLAAVGSGGTTYQVTITPAADGAVTVDLPTGAAADAAGNPSSAATRLVRTADAMAPTATLTAAAGPFDASFTVTATFSEAVTGLAFSDFTVGDGAASNLVVVGSGGTTYQVTITPAADGAVTVDLPAGAAADAAGNPSIAASTLTRTASVSKPPTVTSDGTAPDTVLVKAPRAHRHKRLVVLRFAGTEPGATFQCSVDGGSFKPCASQVVRRFGSGRHTFAVRAVDAAGNVDPTPATVAWKVSRRHR